jgi:hypothetical protein
LTLEEAFFLVAITDQGAAKGVFMADEKNKANRFGGPYMIQDSDHMSEIRQVGGEAGEGSSRQVGQSQGDSQQGGVDHSGGGQQGGEKSKRRPRLL